MTCRIQDPIHPPKLPHLSPLVNGAARNLANVNMNNINYTLELRLHVVLKPVPKPASIQPVWKPPGVNALNRFRNRFANRYANHFREVV